MLHDYWMYGRDTAFARDHLPGQRQVLEYFRRFQRGDGSLSGLPYWAFTDWVDYPGWSSGMAAFRRRRGLFGTRFAIALGI